MKNMLLLICNLAAISFVFAFLFSLANSFFGLRLGLGGAKVPGGGAAAVSFLVIATLFAAVTYFLNRKNLMPE
jgi:hypothetical protein